MNVANFCGQKLILTRQDSGVIPRGYAPLSSSAALIGKRDLAFTLLLTVSLEISFSAIMAYLAPIHRGTSVRHAIKLNILSPDEESLVLA